MQKQKLDTKAEVQAELIIARTKLNIVGVVIGTMTVGGVVACFVIPEHARDLWFVIGPLISTGLLQLYTTSHDKSKDLR